MIGACDICNAQNMELSRGSVAGLEAWTCTDGCRATQQRTDQEREKRIAELFALRDASSRCDCGQECYCAKNFEYAEAELEKLGALH